MLLAELPELGRLTDNQVSTLMGVAPLNNDSGPRRGRRSIKAGRAIVRRSLCMPAMSAVRFNPILRSFYRRLIERGKPHPVAIIAVIRILIRLPLLRLPPCAEAGLGRLPDRVGAGR